MGERDKEGSDLRFSGERNVFINEPAERRVQEEAIDLMEIGSVQVFRLASTSLAESIWVG